MRIEEIVIGRIYRTTENVSTYIKTGALVVALKTHGNFVDVVDLSGRREGDGLWFADPSVLEGVQPLSDIRHALELCRLYEVK